MIDERANDTLRKWMRSSSSLPEKALLYQNYGAPTEEHMKRETWLQHYLGATGKGPQYLEMPERYRAPRLIRLERGIRDEDNDAAVLDAERGAVRGDHDFDRFRTALVAGGPEPKAYTLPEDVSQSDPKVTEVRAVLMMDEGLFPPPPEGGPAPRCGKNFKVTRTLKSREGSMVIPPLKDTVVARLANDNIKLLYGGEEGAYSQCWAHLRDGTVWLDAQPQNYKAQPGARPRAQVHVQTTARRTPSGCHSQSKEMVRSDPKKYKGRTAIECNGFRDGDDDLAPQPLFARSWIDSNSLSAAEAGFVALTEGLFEMARSSSSTALLRKALRSSSAGSSSCFSP
jgi:hypothetical protein